MKFQYEKKKKKPTIEHLVNDSSEISGDFVVGDGVFGRSLIQPDLQKELQVLLLIGAAIVLAWHF